MKDSNKTQLSILFDFFKNRKALVLFTLMLFLFNSAASMVAPFFLGKIIDSFRGQKMINLGFILNNGKEFLGIFVFFVLMQMIAGIFMTYLKRESVNHYQNFLFDKILMLPYLQLIKFRTAYLQSRWGGDSLNLSSFYSDTLFEMIRNVFIIVLGVTAAVYISPVFSLSVMSFIVIMGISITLISRYLVKQMKIYLEKFSSLSGKVNETISGIFELKIMGFLKFFRDTIKQDIIQANHKNFSIQLRAIIIFSFINVIVFAGFFGTITYFGYLIASNKITIGNAVAYAAIAIFVMNAMTSLVNKVNKLNKTFASLKRTMELTDFATEKNEILLSGEHVPGIENEEVARVELQNICFKYEEAGDYVLRNFSYKFEKGKVYAVSGKSGSGKSTLIKILMGVMPPEEGVVSVNGSPLDKSTIPAFWEKLGYFSQDPFLFKGNLRENLAPGNGYEWKNKESKIKEALMDSGLAHMDVSRPIEVEEGGKNFSGGEKRRISLARAFFKDPDVLILDEPTSQVDKATEEVIIDSIVSFARSGKLVIIIAHSDLALQKADEVINLSKTDELPGAEAVYETVHLPRFDEQRV